MSELNVIFEDNHLLVVNKPALLATMGVKEGEDSLVVRAKDYLREKYNKPGNVYVGVVSRLDSYVTGVIVLARTSKSASRLSEQFRNRSATKKYWAIVPAGNLGNAGTLEDRLVKNESRHRMVVLQANSRKQPDEKIARLSYRTLGTCVSNQQELNLIEIELETGRKHQIRVQFENAGCSIVGDRKYGSKLAFKSGIALHSRFLEIEHPTKKVLQSFHTQPPSCWNLKRFALS